MLFLLLIAACFSINQDTLQPVTSGLPSSSLIAIAKTDPRALLEMLDGADPVAIGKIVKILDSLILDGRREALALRNDISNATKVRDDAQKELNRLRLVETTALATYRSLQAVWAKKKGIWTALKNALEKNEPRLTNEINVLTKVLRMLNDILDQNTPKGQDLLELGSSEKGKAYLKLIANVQADPEKVKKIIGFVGTLLNEAKTELSSLEKKVEDAQKVLAEANRKRNAAYAKWVVADKAEEAGADALAQAEGALEAANNAFKKRWPVLVSEEKTLREVIRLLKSTADNNPTGKPVRS